MAKKEHEERKVVPRPPDPEEAKNIEKDAKEIKETQLASKLIDGAMVIALQSLAASIIGQILQSQALSVASGGTMPTKQEIEAELARPVRGNRTAKEMLATVYRAISEIDVDGLPD